MDSSIAFEDTHGDSNHIRIGDLLVDLGRQTVTRNGEHIDLPRLSFDLLLALVSRAPNLVTVDDLIRVVWKGRVINHDTVVHRVTLLRQALGDDSRSPRYIGLVRGRGYRCLAPVTPLSRPDPIRKRSSMMGAVFLIVVAGATFWVAVDRTSSPAEGPAQSVAVLPFRDLGQGPADQYFADGLTEALAERIRASPDLEVLGRTSSFQFRDSELSISELGRRLGVRYLLEGTVSWRPDDRLTIEAQLLAQDGQAIWSRHWARSAGDLDAVQDEIARATVRGIEDQLNVRLRGPPVNPAGRKPIDAHTHRLFLEARGRLRERGSDRIAEAYELFLQVTERAPDFALGWTGLSDSALLLLGWSQRASPNEALAVAERAMDRALALAPDVSEVHKSMGFLHLVRAEQNHEPLPDLAIDEFEIAVRLDPRNAEALTWLAEARASRGDFDRALEVNALAIAGDPLHVVARFNQFDYLVGADRRQSAIDYAQAALADFPDHNWGYKQLAEQLVEAGRPDLALKWIRTGAREARNKIMLHVYAIAYALRLGLSERAVRPWIDSLQELDPALSAVMAHVAKADLGGALNQMRTNPSELKLFHLDLMLAVSAGELDVGRAVLETDYPELLPPLRLEKDSLFATMVHLAGPALWAAQLHQQAGEEDLARAIARTGIQHLDRLPGAHPARSALLRASWQCRLGDRVAALEALEEAETRGWIGLAFSEWVPVRFDQDPLFDCLHGAREFEAFMDRMAAACAVIAQSLHQQPEVDR